MTKAEKERLEQHVMTARKTGIGLARYARENGLSLDEIYSANKRLRSRGMMATSATPSVESAIRAEQSIGKESLSAFVPIEVTAAAPSLIKVLLPNGIELQLDAGTTALSSLLAALMGVQCSR
jgi:hypothetical protein